MNKNVNPLSEYYLIPKSLSYSMSHLIFMKCLNNTVIKYFI